MRTAIALLAVLQLLTVSSWGAVGGTLAVQPSTVRQVLFGFGCGGCFVHFAS